MTPTTTNAPSRGEHPDDLRERAARLTALATDIERSLVMRLPERLEPVDDPRHRLCRVLLERNLHQLHDAADGLRSTALRLRQQAAADDTDVAA